MTNVTITRKDGHIVKVHTLGHTGYAEGEDIVCAALSSVIQTALLGLLKVAAIPVSYKVNEEEGFLQLDVPELNEKDRFAADIILNTMLEGVADLHEGFSKFIGLKIK